MTCVFRCDRTVKEVFFSFFPYPIALIIVFCFFFVDISVGLSDLGLILIIVFILFCLFVVLMERKLLAHAQRRFGPSIAGRNG